MSHVNSQIRTRIWLEEPEPGAPFSARSAYCHGYDVYGDMLGRARWADMVYLLFRGEAPRPEQAALLDALAVALANPGPRDPAVHAAMCAGVGGSTAAASLIAALAVGAGQYTGAREVFLAMTGWRECGMDPSAWQRRIRVPATPVVGIWPEAEHAPGFDPHASVTPTLVQRTLERLAALSPGAVTPWLAAHRLALEEVARAPLALAGVIAAAFTDLGFTPEQGEMLHLLLRLPGAAAHALEQQALGHKQFPFFELDLENDPLEVAR